MEYYQQTAREAFAAQASGPEGLTAGQAAARLAKTGPNELRRAKKESLFQRFLQQMADPMIVVLLAAAALSALTAACAGESFADVFIILAVVLINALLGVFQENKAEKAIEALQKMTAAHSRVLRGGRPATVASRELVPGDVVLLEAGCAVPADGRLVETAALKIEEAALTGESMPVEKSAAALPAERAVPLGDRRCMAYMGSTVSAGRGRLLVTATGMDTEMGRIAGVLAATSQGKTPLQLKLAALSRSLSALVLAICAFLFGFGLWRAGSTDLAAVLSSFMVAVSLAVAAVPEGLAAVVTIVLSMGVTRMSRQGAVIRRLTAVETLGCAQVICSDKTGTLTQNRMEVQQSFGPEAELAKALALCSDAEPGAGGRAEGEPTECALVEYAAKLGLAKKALCAAEPRVAELPFDSARKRMSTFHSRRGKAGVTQYVKGAPDLLLEKCTHWLKNGVAVPLTAAIGRQLGILQSEGQAVTGAQLDRLSDAELARRAPSFSVYARVQPQHKVRIVQAWKRLGCVTAMTGDGVNDAPALKAADIGVGMGVTGTDVTKNVADMVLTDDNFATIVAAVAEGRRIYSNIRKAVQFLLASNASEVLSIFSATLLGVQLLGPVHLLWINLITDCFPALALGMEKAELDVMERAPRRPGESIFAGGLGLDVAWQGLLVTALTLAAYFTGVRLETGLWQVAQSGVGVSMAFLTMSMAEIFHSFNMRSQRGSVFALPTHNPWLWAAMAGSLALSLGVLAWPPAAAAFGFERLAPAQCGLALTLALTVLPAVELGKGLLRLLSGR